MNKTCENYRKAIVSAISGELRGEKVKALKSHLAQCPECARYYRETRAVAELMKSFPLEEPPADSAERLNENIKKSRLRILYVYAGAFAAAAAVIVALVIFLASLSSPEPKVVETDDVEKEKQVVEKNDAPDDKTDKLVTERPKEKTPAPEIPERPSVIETDKKETVEKTPSPETPRPKVEPEKKIAEKEPPLPREPQKQPEPVKKKDRAVADKPETEEAPTSPEKKDVAEDKKTSPEKKSAKETPARPDERVCTILETEGVVYVKHQDEDKPEKTCKGACCGCGCTLETKYSGKVSAEIDKDLILAMNVGTTVKIDRHKKDRYILDMTRGECLVCYVGFDKPVTVKTEAGEFSTDLGTFTLRLKRGKAYVSVLDGTVEYKSPERTFEQPAMTRVVYEKDGDAKQLKWIPLVLHLKWGRKVLPYDYTSLDRPEETKKDDKNNGNGQVPVGPHKKNGQDPDDPGKPKLGPPPPGGGQSGQPGGGGQQPPPQRPGHGGKGGGCKRR